MSFVRQHKDRILATGALALASTGTFAAVEPGTADADTGHDWSGVAQCESSGNWHINSGNGFYGGVQFTQSTWAGFGGLKYAGRADLASPGQQVDIAERVLTGQGIRAWPHCGQFLRNGVTPGGGSVVVRPGPAQHSQPAPAPVGGPVPAAATANAVVAQARTHLGVGYAWGGTSNATGFDCSGLVVRVFADLGLQLPHSAAQIGNMGQLVAGGLANAQPGDVLYWSSPEPHVAIYIGNGEIIAASTFGHPVAEQHVYGTPAVRRLLAAAPAAPVAPPAAPVAPVAPAPVGTYTVVQGDTLSQIAQAHRVTTMALYNANRATVGGNPDLILPGQVLGLPGSAVVPAPAGSGAPPVVQTAAPIAGAPKHAAPVTDPVPGAHISQGFKGAAHAGIDLTAPLGTFEYAAADATVEFAGPASGFGDWIVLSAQVDGEQVDFIYGHEYSTGIFVHHGEVVRVGEMIGRVGANGNSTGPHCHFEVWVGGRLHGHAVDPAAWLAAHGVTA